MVLEQFIIDADIIWDQVGKTFFENPEAKPGRIMRVQVVNAGIIEDLTGYTLNLGWTSVKDPSKFGLDAFDDVDITKGIFEIEYTSGMLTNVGPLNASLQLVPPGEGRPIESNNFKLTVKNSAINPEAIQGETSFKALENALVEVNGWNARIDVVEQEFKDRADALDRAYPVRLTAAEQSVAAVEAQVDLLNRGLGETMASLALLNSTYPAGDTKDHIVAGNIAEVDTLTVTAIPTVAGNITVTLNGVAKTIAVDPAVQTTTTLLATLIRGTAFTGWTTGGTGSVVTFTATTVGTRTAPVFSGEATGTTGTFVRTALGEAANFHRYFWNGTAWTDGGIYQAVEVMDKSVTPIKASFFDHKTNLWTFGDRTITGTGTWNHTEHHISVPPGKYTFMIEKAEGYVLGTSYYAEVRVEVENSETTYKVYALTPSIPYVENIDVPAGHRIHVNLFLSTSVAPLQSQTATFKGISLINGSYAELITPNLKVEYLDVPKILEPTFDVVGSSALVSTSEVVTATNPAAYACRTVTVDVLSDTSYLLDIESVVGSQTTKILGIELLDVNNARISLNFYTTLETPFTTTTLTKKVRFYFYLTYSTGATGTFTATFTNIMLHKLGVLSKLYRVNYDNLSAEIKGLVPIKVVPEIFLPKHFYVALGYPIEIYNNTIIRGGIDKEYVFDWKITSGGKNTGRKLVLTNTEALSGTTSTLTLDVYDNGFNKIGTVTSTIHWVKAATSQNPVSVKKLLYIGDSLTDISTWRTQLYDRLLANVGSNFENVGTLGTAPYLHEGHSGWSINSYLTNAAEGWNGDYKVAVAVAPNITPKKQYRFGTKIFEYEKTETEGGTIWVYFNRVSGAGFVTTADSPATGVDGAVVGTTPISFTSVAVTSLNPFYNATSGTFDINKYSTDYLSGDMPDYTFIWLGTNGASGSMDVATSKANALAEVAKLKTIVDNLSNVSGMKIFIAYNHLRANQTGLGYSAGTAQLTAGYDMYVNNLNKAIYDTFSTYTNVILVPVGQTFDRENNYPTRNTQVNQYNTATFIEQTDPVHPVQSTGFMQFADTFYATVIGNI